MGYKEFTDEELIAVARKVTDNKVISGKKLKKVNNDLEEVQRFIIAFELTKGEHEVEVEGVFQLYEQWSKEPTSKIGFSRAFAKFFRAQRKTEKRYYKLNISAFDISIKTTELKKKNEEKY